MTSDELFTDQYLYLQFKTRRDCSAATVKKILFTRPDLTTGFWIPTVLNGHDLIYETQTGDINMPGKWKLQAYVEIGTKCGPGKTIYLFFKTRIAA